MNGTDTERLSQKGKCNKAPVDSILEEAEAVARGVLESIQTLTGTTACKGIQIKNLKAWAVANNHWIDDVEVLGNYADRGLENEVYLSKDNETVYKLNDFRYSDDNLTPFFDRLEAQKLYFPDCAYILVGFAMNRSGKVCAVIRQSYIISSREATEAEINHELQELGFEPQMNGECYSNGIHDIFDATPGNVLVGIDGNLYFIDTIIYKSDDSNMEIYRTQSPRFNNQQG